MKASTTIKRLIVHVPLLTIILVLYNLLMFAAPQLIRTEIIEQPAVVEAVTESTDTAAEGDQPLAAQKPTSMRIVRQPAPIFSIPLPSGAKWAPTVNDLILILAVLFLYVEVVKSTNTRKEATFEHVTSLMVSIIFLLEFLMIPRAGTPTFLVLTFLSFVDVVGGFSITIAATRRDMNVAHPGAGYGDH